MRHLSEELSCCDDQVSGVRLMLPLVLAFACFFALASTAGGQQPEKPLSKDQVKELLKGGDSSARVQYLVIERGIDFAMNTQTEEELTQAGANHELILLLRRLAPAKPAEATPTEKKDLQTDTQIYDFQFKMPQGWKRVDATDANKAARLEPSNLPSGTAAILIYPGEELNGEPACFL
jgi:hypothetical protein